MRYEKSRSLLRSKVSFARAHVRVFHAAHLDFDLAKAAVANFVRRIVAQAVLSANLVGHLRKRRSRLLLIAGNETFSSGSAGHLAHLLPRQIVKLPAYVHAFQLSQATEVLVVFFLCPGRKEASKSL